MFDLANGEKKLMALINATVSHEMRNPTNSIQG
jgi:signal transduction histidine kinase